MAREIIAWCDVHLGESEGAERIAGRPVTISLGMSTSPVQVDLCEAHEIELVKPLRDVLTEYGIRADDVPVVSPRRTRQKGGDWVGEFKCNVEGCGTVTRSLGTLRSHSIAVHKQSLADLTGTAAYVCPAPDCGLGYESVQGVSVHLARSHNWTQSQRDEWRAKRTEPHVTSGQIGKARAATTEDPHEPPLPTDPVERKRERDRRRGTARRAAARAAGRG